MIRKPLSAALVLGVVFACGTLDARYSKSPFNPNGFPGRVSDRIFSVPLDPAELLVVYPAALEPDAARLAALLAEKCGRPIPFRSAAGLRTEDLAGKHLILLGNISNNPWALELYKRRRAFADAVFPGKDGYIIHPATSIWDRERNVLVIGASTDAGLGPAFEAFVSLLAPGAAKIETLHRLKTGIKMPAPPETIDAIAANVRRNLRTARAPYGRLGGWGLNYFLTGDAKWAGCFRDGFYLAYEQAEQLGDWVPEPWTSVYFSLRSLFQAWDLIDDDPFFTPRDRRIIEEVLWGYTIFVRNMILLDEDVAPAGEPRQNHTAHMGLGLYFAHRYYTEKYGLTGLEPMLDQVRLAFDRGQNLSYRPNDDAAGYQLASPADNLVYNLARGDESFLKDGRLRRYIDLLTATTDNRGDMVGFGDTSSYAPHDRRAGGGGLAHFARTAAWFYREGQFQWLADWTTDRDVPGSLADGDYAIDLAPEPPARYTGVFPVWLDEPSLLFAARRAEKTSWAPRTGERYFDKLSLRRSFDPGDEYLCLEGTSFFSHGHHDGNTVTRLTWKDRIWLFDVDYIDFTPRYHSGIAVARDGRQDDPPPLNTLDAAADFGELGLLRTTSAAFNGADWRRNIVWRKGRYFLFLDRLEAREDGDYRLDCRWRTRGDIAYDRGVLTVRQGDRTFAVKSADDAPRRVVFEPDKYRSTWDYPYGDGRIGVLLARKRASLGRGDDWTFASLMSASGPGDPAPPDVFRLRDGLYLVRDGARREIAGLDPEVLSEAGVATDCRLFVCEGSRLQAAGATRLRFSSVSLRASGRVHLEIDFATGSGRLIVPEGGPVRVEASGVAIDGVAADSFDVSPGARRLAFGKAAAAAADLVKVLGGGEVRVLPEPWPAAPATSGLEIAKRIPAAAPLTCRDAVPEGLLAGDANGRVIRFRGDASTVLFQVPSGRPLSAIRSADIDGDGAAEILAGDDQEMLFCFDAAGKLRWSFKMVPTNGSGVAADITVGDIDGRGKPVILVATKSWKLYAFEPDGKVRWESFLFYHPSTKVRILDEGGPGAKIAVGNVYHTPLDVVSPADGSVLWHTWEQCGGEAYSTTDYCGLHLTDMVFLDTDGDGRKEIVFGTKYNRVYALNAADGATKWTAVVGDEVTAVRILTEPATGEPRLLVATDAGELVKLDRRGDRLAAREFADGISDLLVLESPGRARCGVVAALRGGGVVVCDDELLTRASGACPGPLSGLAPAGKEAGAELFYAVGDEAVTLMRYRPFFLRKSRTY